MGENVGVALELFSLREAPVSLGRASIVIFYECNSSTGPPTHDTRWFAGFVREAPVFVSFKYRMQNALCGDIKRTGVATRGVKPIDDALSMGILVVFRGIKVVS